MNPQLAIPPEVERVLANPPRLVPKAEHLEPFLEAAREVLEQELGTVVERGRLTLAEGNHTTQEITAIVGITGRLTGLAIYGMSEATALSIVGRLLGQPMDTFDDLAMSGIAELGNVITGRAATLLSDAGLESNIAPPVTLVGAGARVSTAGIQRLVVPLATELGVIEAQLAVKGTG